MRKRERQGVLFGVGVVFAVALLSGWSGYELHAHLSPQLERLVFAALVGANLFSLMVRVIIAIAERMLKVAR